MAAIRGLKKFKMAAVAMVTKVQNDPLETTHKSSDLAKFGFQVDYELWRIDIHRWFAMVAILNPKWPPKYKNPLIWAKFGFQVDFDVGN